MIQLEILKDVFGWGFVLWLFGYIAGILLFFFFPTATIGWLIMPVGAVLTWWISKNKLYDYSLKGYLIVGVSWALMAAILDYAFIVKLFSPPDGYYKLDVYIYYFLVIAIPLSIGIGKSLKTTKT